MTNDMKAALAADIDMLKTVLLENQKVLVILRDACTHEPTRRVLADLMDANTRALAISPPAQEKEG
jgi:hypothetical protein